MPTPTPVWKFYLYRSAGSTEITQYVKIREVNVTVAGNNNGTSFNLPLIGFDPASATDQGRVPRLNDIIYITRWSDKTNSATEVIKAVGVVTEVSREDNYSVAGVSPKYNITVSDGAERLKQRIFKQYTKAESDDPKNEGARAQEWPKWFRINKAQANAYGKKYAKTPQQMLEWVIDLINRSENGQANPVILGVVTPVPQLTMPVVDKDDPSGYSTKLMKFDQNYPFVADGRTYFSAIDSVCQMAGLNWCLEPYLDAGVPKVKVRTWPAYWLDDEDEVASYRASIEIADDPNALPIKIGNTVAAAQAISGSEDKNALVNYVVYSWEPVNKSGLPTGTKVAYEKNAASITAYGRHDELLPTTNLTKVAAQAEALKIIRQHRRPDFRGSATIRYNATFKPGSYVYLHRTKHANTGNTPYWVRLSQSISMSYSFSEAAPDPVWMSIEFGDSTYAAKARGIKPKDKRSAGKKASAAPGSEKTDPSLTVRPGRLWSPNETPASGSQAPVITQYTPDVEIPHAGSPKLVMLDTIPMRRLWATHAANVAINANGTATAISSAAFRSPEDAFDGQDLTYWVAGSTTLNAWLKFDFGTATGITGYYVNEDVNGGGANTYSLQYSTDNTNWTNEVTGLTGDTSGSFGAVSARYWRLYRTAQAGTASAFKIINFELYGDAEDIELGSLNNRHRGAVISSSGAVIHAEQWESAVPYGASYWVGNPVAQFRDTVYDSSTGYTYNACSTPVIVGFGASGWTSTYKNRVKSVRVFLALTNRFMGDDRRATRVRIRTLPSIPALNKGTAEYLDWANSTGAATPVAKAHWRALTGGDDWMRSTQGLVQEFELDPDQNTTRIAIDVVPRLYTVPNQKDDTTDTVMGVFLAVQPVATAAAPAVPSSMTDHSNYAEVIVGNDYNLEKQFTVLGNTSTGFGQTGGTVNLYPLEYLGKKIFSSTAPSSLIDSNRLQKPMDLVYAYPARATLSSTNYNLNFSLNDGPTNLTDSDCFALVQIDEEARLFGDALTFQHKLSQTYPGQTIWEFAPVGGDYFPADPSGEISVYIEGSPARKEISTLCRFSSSDGNGYRTIDISPVRLGGLRAGEQLVIVYSPLGA